MITDAISTRLTRASYVPALVLRILHKICPSCMQSSRMRFFFVFISVDFGSFTMFSYSPSSSPSRSTRFVLVRSYMYAVRVSALTGAGTKALDCGFASRLRLLH